VTSPASDNPGVSRPTHLIAAYTADLHELGVPTRSVLFGSDRLTARAVSRLPIWLPAQPDRLPHTMRSLSRSIPEDPATDGNAQHRPPDAPGPPVTRP